MIVKILNDQSSKIFGCGKIMTTKYCPFEKGQSCCYFRRYGDRFGFPGESYCLKYESPISKIKKCNKTRKYRSHVKGKYAKKDSGDLFEELYKDPLKKDLMGINESEKELKRHKSPEREGKIKPKRKKNKRIKGRYHDGVKIGIWTEFYPNGRMKKEGTYNNGSKEGKWSYWHINGKQNKVEFYIDAKKDGIWEEWYSNGNKKKIETYKDGFKEGKYYYWYRNGQIKIECQYEHGKKQGKWIEWYKNGQKKETGEYEKGDKVKLWVRWYEDGLLKEKGKYKEGEKSGKWISWDRDGENKQKTEYVWGVEKKKSYPL